MQCIHGKDEQDFCDECNSQKQEDKFFTVSLTMTIQAPNKDYARREFERLAEGHNHIQVTECENKGTIGL